MNPNEFPDYGNAPPMPERSSKMERALSLYDAFMKKVQECPEEELIEHIMAQLEGFPVAKICFIEFLVRSKRLP